jgi:hypothetical protein
LGCPPLEFLRIGYELDPPSAHGLGDCGGAGQIKPRVYFGVVCGLGLVTVLALEFQLGADIVATTVNPSLQALGELAAEAGLVEKMLKLMATPEGSLKNLELS